MTKEHNIPTDYKRIYSRGLNGKHIATTKDEKYVAHLREILSTTNKESYEERFHHLLRFEESKERECLQEQTLQCVRLQYAATLQKRNVDVPGMERKQHYIRPNNSVVLISLLDSKKYYARIDNVDVKKNKLTIFFDKPPRIYKDEQFKLVFMFSNYQYKMMHAAVEKIPANKHKTKIFPQKNFKCNKIKSIITWFNPQIGRNKEQRMAVEHIVARTAVPAPYILHGPPGTGKTATIVEAILQVLRTDSSNRVLVCAPSNSAADDVASKLIKYESLFPELTFLLRRNSQHRDRTTLPACLAEHSCDPFKNCRNELDFVLVLRNVRIIVSTISYAPEAVKKLRHITHLFIDEAAQATEPLCLVPITELLVDDGLLVLSGDPLQLGPVLASEFAKKYGLGISLMERLMKDTLYNGESNDPNYTVMLKKNFRSHADILHIPNTQFYKRQLEACAKDDVISTKDILFEKQHSRAIVFCAVFGQEAQEKQSSSYYNEEELQMLKFSINKILSGKYKVKAENIGIITPYTAQVDKIKKWLNSTGKTAIEVGSVESYQGREKEIILMSTVRGQGKDSTKKVKLGFLADYKRFNVAVTRAKAKLIVIGNPVCLKIDEMWRVYIKTCLDMGSYYKITLKDKPKSDQLMKITSGLRKMHINSRK